MTDRDQKMNNNDNKPDPELNEEMAKAAKTLGLGATKDYPQGPLSLADEGGLKIAITDRKGKLIINFGKPIDWLGFDRNQAIEFAKTILKRARNMKG